jgi:hypothetical protein
MGVASKEKCLYWLQNISKWIETNKSKRNYFICKRKVVLFCDEFTNYWCFSGDWRFELLTKLGYEVIFVDHEESGRAIYLKVFLKKRYCQYKRSYFTPIISQEVALIGIEPSAILTFRDEHSSGWWYLPLKSWQKIAWQSKNFSKGNYCW